MPVEYVNRKGQTYYLRQGKTKTGKPKYFVSMKDEGTLVDAIPDGYEIYENPNAQVFLRRVRPKIITDEEIAVVERAMQRFCPLQNYQIDVKKEIISIFVPDQDMDRWSEILSFTTEGRSVGVEEVLAQILTYSPMLQFVLVDKEKRVFAAQRYCFLGSIDDWIYVGEPDTLRNLAERYVKHLGQDSYFELL